jgi:hypothetical protein
VCPQRAHEAVFGKHSLQWHHSLYELPEPKDPMSFRFLPSNKSFTIRPDDGFGIKYTPLAELSRHLNFLQPNSLGMRDFEFYTRSYEKLSIIFSEKKAKPLKATKDKIKRQKTTEVNDKEEDSLNKVAWFWQHHVPHHIEGQSRRYIFQVSSSYTH